jgi:glutathione S-transferase
MTRAATSRKASPYELYYWPGIPGRGEFVRLALEEADAPYLEMARLPKSRGGGVPAMMKAMHAAGPLEPFAPPFLKAGKTWIAQTANILLFLGPRHRLLPGDEASRFKANQIQLTIADLVTEAHDTHHPIAPGLYYEDQRAEAKKNAASFAKERIPKFLSWMERVLEASGGKGFVGRSVSYVDLSAFHLLAGLDYAFPKAMRRVDKSIPRLRALGARIADRPRVAAYLESSRRVAFNEDGIFRRYPELDA